MLVHKMFTPVRAILPGKLSGMIRSIFTAVLTPLYFSYETGHSRSSLKSEAVNKRGEPIPWYTYPAIEFLESKDFRDCAILEFGAGQSTLWWGKRARLVLSLEEDFQWYSYVKKNVPPNVNIVHISQDLVEVESSIGDYVFDVIIIDGLDRVKAGKIAREVVKGNGAIILDNAEGFWGPEGTYPIMDFFRSEGFCRIDFYGYAPAVIVPHCTSIFFKYDCFLLKGSENPVRRVP